MNSMELMKPSVAFKEQYLASLDECDDIKETRHEPDSIELARRDFDQFIVQLLGQEEGKFLKPGWIPCTTYWLVDDGVFIGRVSIRHELNEHLPNIGGHIGYNIRPSKRNKGYGTEILRLGLEKAKSLGMGRVFITCDETNIGSKKIIEANGGVFEKFFDMGEGRPRKMHFWITLI